MIDISELRHEKEKTYFTIGAIFSIIVWLFLVWFAWLYLIPVAIFSWLAGQYFKASLYGNAIKVNSSQFPELNGEIQNFAKSLGMTSVPDVFVLSGQGALNALAIRVLSGKYILLYGELVDLMLKRKAMDELKMIIGHELAHHALGHVSIGKNLLLIPARLIPFLGGAYSRACELSADRAGLRLCQNPQAAKTALLALCLGSETLAENVNATAFRQQEQDVPAIMGFIYEILSTHPRMTIRIRELEKLSIYSTIPSAPSF